MPDIDLATRPVMVGMTDRVDAARKAADNDALTRFVDGICRAIGAVAGCLVVEDQQSDGERRIHGRAWTDAAADAALTLSLAAAPAPGSRGHAWLRDAAVPAHRCLALDASVPGVLRQLMLVFDARSIEPADATDRVMAMAPGLAAAAGAMHDTWLACDATAERQRLLAAAMNQSECGIIVVRADHSVLFSNPAAQAILATRDGIELRRDQLRPTRYQDAIRFQASLDHVLTLPAEAGQPSRHSMMLLLDRPDQHRPLIAVIAPAAAESAEGGAAAIVYVMRPELSGLRGVEVICQLHGLSPVETQLVARLVAGATLSEAAFEMRIKPDTARAYLKQVFAKTDTHRQADLIQLVIRYQRAVRGDFLFHAA
ncbi:helix-turn-helix transcriptional regulator [Sphingomonas sp. 1P08PE]|uniref:helix-turn-helix transcriptional regulator n=1 Tax=Sphingomonas sp. 1P08PE TaxID=554122 RepID=UPI00399F873E